MNGCFCDECPHGLPHPLWAATHCPDVMATYDVGAEKPMQPVAEPGRPEPWRAVGYLPHLFLRAV